MRLTLLACCLTAVSLFAVGCDSSNPGPKEVEYPDEGDYGVNLLSGKLDEAVSAPMHDRSEYAYSLSAVVPEGAEVELRMYIERVKEDCFDSIWGVRTSSVVGWTHTSVEAGCYGRDFKLREDTYGDAKILIEGEGTLVVEIAEIYEEGEEPKKIEIPFAPTE